MRLANFPFTLPHQLYSPELQVSWTLSPPPISTTFTGNFRLPISTSFQGQSFSLASFVNGVEIPVMSIEMTQLPT